MKVIKADVNDDIIFNTIEDIDTGIVTGITSTLILPTGNLNNILIDFNFINKKLPQELRILANFNINEKVCIDVPLEKHIVGENTYENACYIPAEVFEEPCYFMLGLYGFALENETEIKERISLIPLKNIVIKGSYDPDAKEGIIPTPTAFEVYFNNVAEVNNQMLENLDKFNKELENKVASTNDLLNEKLMFAKIFTSDYFTTTENETDIPINIDVFNEITPLEVFINGIRKSLNIDYTIDHTNKKIILTKALDVIGTPVNFACYKTAFINNEDYELLRGEKGEKGEDGAGAEVLTGSIIEYSGDIVPEGYEAIADYTLTSNDYGTAKKFSDGFMICTKTISFSNVAFNLQQGNLYFCSTLELGRTAETFANIPRVFINVSSGWGLIAGARSQTSSSFGLTQLFRGDNTEQATITLDLVAFGRLK